VAVGFDRLVMLITGASTISEVLLFPAAREYARARQ
jgi:lysyl-tRNA synthetase class II